MNAVVKYGQKDGMVELRDVPVPQIGPQDVLLEVKAAGVCGSDIEMYRHRVSFPVNTPVIQGHEFAGVIAEVGGEVEGFSVGDRVVSETAAYICGRCPLCRSGEYNLCPERLGFGYGTDGAFTRFVCVPARCLHPVPEGVPFDAAALTEPLCVAYNALVVKSRVIPGEPVVVLGPGPIGLFALQIARLSGAGPIIITGADADTDRLGLAKKMGADVTARAGRDDPVEKVAACTDGFGAPLVVDASGSSQTLYQALNMVRRNGQITKIGWGPEPVGFSLDPLLSKAATLQGVYSHTWRTWEACLHLIQRGQVDMASMISHRLSILEWKRAYELVETRTAIKVILTPEE